MSFYHSTPGANQLFSPSYMLAVHNPQRLAWTCHPCIWSQPGILLGIQPPDQETQGPSVWAVARSEHGRQKWKCEAWKRLASDQMQEQGRPDRCDASHHWSCGVEQFLGFLVLNELSSLFLHFFESILQLLIWHTQFIQPPQRPPLHVNSPLPLTVRT